MKMTEQNMASLKYVEGYEAGVAAARATPPALKRLRRDQVIDLISSMSKNPADCDIAFAERIMDAMLKYAETAAQAAPVDALPELPSIRIDEARNFAGGHLVAPAGITQRREQILRAIITEQARGAEALVRATTAALQEEWHKGHDAGVRFERAEAIVRGAPRVEVKPLTDERFFDLTLEHEGRQIQVTFNRHQLEDLAGRLRAHGIGTQPGVVRTRT
jgi:hypothetical protein